MCNFAIAMKYSRKSLDKAGRALLDPFTRSEVVEKVSSWRMTHLPVLRVFVNWDDVYGDSNDGYCVLSINFMAKTVAYRTYPLEDEDAATSTFAQMEQNIDSNEAVLLVSIAKMQELREAYPSYFLDTKEFLSALSEFDSSCRI